MTHFRKGTHGTKIMKGKLWTFFFLLLLLCFFGVPSEGKADSHSNGHLKSVEVNKQDHEQRTTEAKRQEGLRAIEKAEEKCEKVTKSHDNITIKLKAYCLKGLDLRLENCKTRIKKCSEEKDKTQSSLKEREISNAVRWHANMKANPPVENFMALCPEYTLDRKEKEMESFTTELGQITEDKKTISDELLTLEENISGNQMDLKKNIRGIKKATQKAESTLQAKAQEEQKNTQIDIDGLMEQSIKLQEEFSEQERKKATALLTISKLKSTIQEKCKEIAQKRIAGQIKNAKKGLTALGKAKAYIKKAYTQCTQSNTHKVQIAIANLRSIEAKQQSLHQRKALLVQRMKRAQDRFEQTINLDNDNHVKFLFSQQEALMAANERHNMEVGILLKEQRQKSQKMQKLVQEEVMAQSKKNELSKKATLNSSKSLQDISLQHQRYISSGNNQKKVCDDMNKVKKAVQEAQGEKVEKAVGKAATGER